MENAFPEKILEHTLDGGERQQLRDQIFDDLRVLDADTIQHLLGFLAREQFRSVALDQFREMRWSVRSPGRRR
jgi:hypothetical protein